MLILIENLLDSSTLQAITTVMADSAAFEDGKNTAGRTARQVKSNLQAKMQNTETRGAVALIEKAILKHPVFQAAAIPAKFAKIMFNRYEPGMAYGSHVDDAIIANTRTDLSFTLFLSEPESYEGGELVIQKHDGDEAIKLSAGSLVLYPSTSLHYVSEVKTGIRLAAVGWLQSKVRLAEHREILFDLHYALTNLPDTEQNRTARLSLLKAKNNITRLWTE